MMIINLVVVAIIYNKLNILPLNYKKTEFEIDKRRGWRGR